MANRGEHEPIDYRGRIILQTYDASGTRATVELTAWDIDVEQEWGDNGQLRHTVTFSCPYARFEELRAKCCGKYVGIIIELVGRPRALSLGSAYSPLRCEAVVVRNGLGGEFAEEHVEVRVESYHG